jgi:hypothetical protein
MRTGHLLGRMNAVRASCRSPVSDFRLTSAGAGRPYNIAVFETAYGFISPFKLGAQAARSHVGIPLRDDTCCPNPVIALLLRNGIRFVSFLFLYLSSDP